MRRGRLSTGNRLRFESGLAARVQRDGRRPLRVGRAIVLLAGLAAIVALAIWASHFIRFPSRSVTAEPAARMSNTILAALKARKIEDALTVCADGEQGAVLLRDDDQQHAKAPQAGTDPVPRMGECRAFLAAMQEELAQQGVAWEQVHPIAFGGVEAKVLDAQTMKEPATAITGAIYFAAGDTVYALELTARLCKSSAVVTDFWNCAAVNVPANGVEGYAEQRYRAFKEEPAKPGQKTTLKSARYVFAPLGEKAR